MQHVGSALGQSSIYAVFQGLILLGSLVSFPILTRILSVSEYGALALINTTATLLVALAKCGIATAFLRHHAQVVQQDQTRQSLCSTAFWTTLAVAVAVAGVYGTIVAVAGPVGTLTRPLLLVVTGIVVIYAVRDLYYAFLRAEEKVLRVSYTMLGLRLGGLAGGLLLAVLWEQKLLGFFLGALAIEGTAVVVLWSAYARRGLLRPGAASSELAKKLLVYGAPLIVFELCSLANDYMDRYLLAQFLGLESVGIYSVGYNLATYVQAIVVAPVWLALFPIYSRMWESEGREATERFLGSVLGIYTAVTLGIFLLVALAGHDLVRLLASEKFAPSGTIFICVCAVLMLYGSTHVLGAGFHLLKRTGTLAAITAAAALLNIGLNFVLIPRMGVMGAVYSSIVSYVALTLGISLRGRSLLRVRVSWGNLVRQGVAAALAWLAVAWIELASPAADLAVRTVGGALFYVACLYWLDERVREGLRLIVHKGSAWMERRA